jgi:hypothetical protein
VQYVRDNRAPEESRALRLMRLYRLGEIVWYYTDKVPRSSGNLRILNQKRVEFWLTVLETLLKNAEVPHEIIETYVRTRDSLRSPEERARQIGLH